MTTKTTTIETRSTPALSGPGRQRKIAQNFVDRHGLEGLQRLLAAFERQDSGQVIADAFGVSRERVRQWRDTFGRAVSFYQPHPEVRRVAWPVSSEGSQA